MSTMTRTKRVKAKRVHEGMGVVLFGNTYEVTEVDHKGYKLVIIGYQTHDSGGYAWTGRLALRHNVKVKVVTNA